MGGAGPEDEEVVVCKAACWEGGLLSMLALPGMLMSCAPEWCAPEGGGKERVREEGGGSFRVKKNLVVSTEEGISAFGDTPPAAPAMRE